MNRPALASIARACLLLPVLVGPAARLAASAEGDRPPRPLEGRARDNLVAFTRLLGYVRYFHPTERVASADWERFAVENVEAIENAGDPAELAAQLEAVFRPFAPAVRVYPSGSEPPLEPGTPRGKEVVYWRHFGVGTGEPRSRYSSALARVIDGPGQNQVGLIRKLDAAPWRGRRVRFTAAARAEVEGGGHQGQLAFRVYAGRRLAFSDAGEERPITSAAWSERGVAADVPEDATMLYLALGLSGEGRVWYDDVRLELVDAEDAADGGGPQANRIVYGPLGFEDGRPGSIPGGWQFLQNAPEVLYSVAVNDERPYRGDRSVTIRGHLYGAEGPPDPDRPFRADLGGGVSCRVPLAMRVAAQDADPPTPPEDPVEPPYRGRAQGWAPSGNDRTTRLAGVALAWNVFQHFYPYFDVVETDWEAALRNALASAATDENGAEFFDTLRSLVAALHDGHGRVQHPDDEALSRPPILWDWIEERLVVTRVAAAGDAALRPGDVVLEVDGQPAAEALARLNERISAATPQWRRHRALVELARGERGSRTTLRVLSRDGAERTVVVERDTPLWGEGELREVRPDPVAELGSDVVYVDLDRVDDAAFAEALPRMAAARGIVFDLRGYPRFNFAELVAHLIDEPVTSAQWHIPVARRPDRQTTDYHFSNWTVPPKKPRLRARVAFLTHGGAISAAETLLGIVEHYRLGAIVGSATAGTNGNVNPFDLPGGYRVFWTGMRVLKHDGSRHHGVGILPTVPVTRTIRGVAEGRDELLERAVSIVAPRP